MLTLMWSTISMYSTTPLIRTLAIRIANLAGSAWPFR